MNPKIWLMRIKIQHKIIEIKKIALNVIKKAICPNIAPIKPIFRENLLHVLGVMKKDMFQKIVIINLLMIKDHWFVTNVINKGIYLKTVQMKIWMKEGLQVILEMRKREIQGGDLKIIGGMIKVCQIILKVW